MQKDKKFYDDFFTKYPINVHDNPDRFSAVSSLLTGRVLDVACGTGTLCDYYLGDYVGVDISDVAINKAKAVRRKDAKFRAFDVCVIPTVSMTKFDNMYIGEFLEHIENDDLLFSRLLKLLNPGGKIYITVPNGDRIPDESHCRTFTVPQIRKDYAKYGKITFHNWSGFAGRIMFSIEPGKTNSNDITLVMIAKDEAKGIERALISALPLVDKIVVRVDDISTDQTLELARMYADDCEYFTWQNDFSRARNEAQAGVESKWILFLDGHEYIEEIGTIREKMVQDVEGLLVKIRLENGMTFLFPRIYRNFVQFSGAVHNQNICKTTAVADDFLIVHDRINGQDDEAVKRREAQKEKMMPEILGERLRKNKKDTRASFHLGNFYLMHKNYKQAIKFYKMHIKFCDNPEETWMTAINLGICQQALKHYLRAFFAFAKADRLLPGRWETARLLGGNFVAMGFHRDATKWLVQSFNTNTRKHMYDPFPRDLMNTWDLLGGCFVQLNEKAKAVTAFERAAQLAETDDQKNFFATKIKFVKML